MASSELTTSCQQGLRRFDSFTKRVVSLMQNDYAPFKKARIYSIVNGLIMLRFAFANLFGEGAQVVAGNFAGGHYLLPDKIVARPPFLAISFVCFTVATCSPLCSL